MLEQIRLSYDLFQRENKVQVNPVKYTHVRCLTCTGSASKKCIFKKCGACCTCPNHLHRGKVKSKQKPLIGKKRRSIEEFARQREMKKAKQSEAIEMCSKLPQEVENVVLSFLLVGCEVCNKKYACEFSDRCKRCGEHFVCSKCKFCDFCDDEELCTSCSEMIPYENIRDCESCTRNVCWNCSYCANCRPCSLHDKCTNRLDVKTCSVCYDENCEVDSQHA